MLRVNCSHCNSGYSIPKERIRQFGDHVVFPCPSCKEKIEIHLQGNHIMPGAAFLPGAFEKPSGDMLKKKILRSVNGLAPMPQVVHEAQKIMADRNTTFSQIATVIEADPAIAARVLKLANSAYYGVMGTVASVQHASVVLGTKTLNQLLQIAGTSKLLGPRLGGYGMASGDLWRHSVAVAGCARMIAKRTYAERAEDAFTAGLFHDCGKLILDTYIVDMKEEFVDFLRDGRKSFIEAERSILGFDHAWIAGEVCEKWHIEKKLSQAIQFHHNPSSARHNELAQIVHAANAIVRMSSMPEENSDGTIGIHAEALSILKLDRSQIQLLIKETRDYVEKTFGAFC